jgi:hypothetical protein
MFNTAKFTLLQVELEFDRVEERHHNQLKLNNDKYQNSPEMKANIAVMDIMGAATLELRKVVTEYKKSQ